MSSATINELKTFQGKVCTVFIAGPLSMKFDLTQFADYFTGRIDLVTDEGIFATHPITGCRNFYPLKYVAGVCEEQVLDPSKPEDAEIIKQVKARSTSQKTDPVDISSLERLAKLS